MDALFLKLLKLFDELGLWKDGVELIGSWSFLLYQRHLGVRPLPLRTQDVDFLLPWPYPARSTVGLSDALSELGFAYLWQLSPRKGLRFCEGGVTKLRQGGRAGFLARGLRKLAVAYLVNGRLRKAYEARREAKSVASAHGALDQL